MLRPSHLYVHLPFCRRKCNYCDFGTVKYQKDLVDVYLASLAEEMEQRCSHLSPSTIYIGGGTPTTLNDSQLNFLFSLIEKLDLSCVEEFTIEANPGTVSIEKLMFLFDAGVNRISFGIQSFNDDALRLLGRIHTSKQGRAAVVMAREAGFENISIDLINSWPGETLDMWLADMQVAVKVSPEHISAYGLTYEEGTPLYCLQKEGRLQPLNMDAERVLFDLMGDFLPSVGYERYEISAFAKRGYESKHNLSYWTGKEYIGVGATACSYVNNVRFTNFRNPNEYIRAITDCATARCWQEELTPEHRARERAVINFRLTSGINIHEFESDTGFSLLEMVQNNEYLLRDGWLEIDDDNIRLSKKALPIADSILQELI